VPQRADQHQHGGIGQQRHLESISVKKTRALAASAGEGENINEAS